MSLPVPEQHAKPWRFDSPFQEAFLNLWRTYDRLRTLEDELFNAHGLSAQQYNALRLLRAAHPGPIPTLVLARRLISRAPDITRLVDKLERQGLIERQRHAQNRRVVEVRITQAGLAKLKALKLQVRAMHARQLAHLSPDDLHELTRLLKLARSPHEDASCIWLEEGTTIADDAG